MQFEGLPVVGLLGAAIADYRLAIATGIAVNGAINVCDGHCSRKRC